jgi:hypothetical protein
VWQAAFNLCNEEPIFRMEHWMHEL